jgi:hypothetical protein
MRGGISIPFGLTDLFYNDPYEVASDADISNGNGNGNGSRGICKNN